MTGGSPSAALLDTPQHAPATRDAFSHRERSHIQVGDGMNAHIPRSGLIPAVLLLPIGSGGLIGLPASKLRCLDLQLNLTDKLLKSGTGIGESLGAE